MMRRHATWMLIHPRSATLVSCFVILWRSFHCSIRYAVAYVPGSFRDSPAPRLWYGGCVATTISVATGRDPPMFRGSGLRLGRRRDGVIAPYRFGHAGRVTLPVGRDGTRDPTSWPRRGAALPWLWPGGGYSVPLLAAQSRHEKPYQPMLKINFRLVFSETRRK